MARIGINGFGRIGRYLVRLMAERNEFPVVINARADNASLAHLFKYDSVHHTFKGTVGHDENGIIINGTHIAVTRCKPNEWQWKDYGVDLVVESTGTIKKRAGLAEHMACGAKKVIMSAPVSDADITIVMGVNDGLYDPAKHDVVSSASCTTNCLAPVAKVLNDTFGIEHGLMTTIHSYTMSQRILDGSQKDIRRARAAAADYKHVGIVVYIVQLYILAQNAAFAVQQVAQLRGNLIALVGAYGKINKAVLTVVRMKPAKQLVLFLRAHTLKLRAYSLRSACFHSFYRIQHFLCQHLFFLPISRCLCGCTYPEAPQAAWRRSRLRHR